MRKIFSVSIYGVGLGLGSVLACVSTSHEPNHCMNNDGDAWCGERYPDGSRPYCGYDLCFEDVADGCVAERPEPECHSACGDRMKLSEDPDCEGVADASSTDASGSDPTTEPTGGPTDGAETLGTMSDSMTGSETESASSTGPSGCANSDECTDPANPICAENVCVPCTEAGDGDTECAAKDANAPACRDDGECVQCTSLNASACADTTPVCDPGASACVGCAYHEQCEGTACDIATGACFDDTCVVEVDGDGGADSTTIMPVIEDGCVVIIHERTGDLAYQEALVIDGGTVALLAADGEEPIVGATASPALSVGGGASVYVQGVRFSQSTALGVSVDDASVYLDRTRVVLNSGGGLSLTGGAYGRTRNSFVGGANNQPAVEVLSSSLDATYSTLGGAFGASPGLVCTNPQAVVVRSSIIVAQANEELACDDAVITYTATEQGVAGMGNVAVGTLEELEWFAGYDGGDFHLTPGGGNTGAATFVDIALWNAGDPMVDIDGNARPNVDGTPDVAGADVP